VEHTNIRLGWKCLPGYNTSAYYNTSKICGRNFANIWPSSLNYKSFTIIIFDDDSGQYKKTKVVANLAFAGSVNYDRKTFKVQTAGLAFFSLG